MKVNVSRIIELIISLVILTMSVWAIVFSAYVTALIILLFVLPFIPIKNYSSKKRFLTFLIVSALTLVTIYIPIKEINNQVAELAKKPRDANSINNFTLRDKLSIYGLHLLMSFVGFPLYPEASKEVFLMSFPIEGNTRYFNSDFPLGSIKINKEIQTFIETLNNSTDNNKTLTKRIAWRAQHYVLGDKEARYALALNPSMMTLTATKIDSRWKIEVVLSVPVSYPANYNAPLIKSPDLYIQEGLFWVLQEAGWLHPYTAKWRFTIFNN